MRPSRKEAEMDGERELAPGTVRVRPPLPGPSVPLVVGTTAVVAVCLPL